LPTLKWKLKQITLKIKDMSVISCYRFPVERPLLTFFNESPLLSVTHKISLCEILFHFSL
jgi:hypothetical protein